MLSTENKDAPSTSLSCKEHFNHPWQEYSTQKQAI